MCSGILFLIRVFRVIREQHLSLSLLIVIVIVIVIVPSRPVPFSPSSGVFLTKARSSQRRGRMREPDCTLRMVQLVLRGLRGEAGLLIFHRRPGPRRVHTGNS
jgi:hypothetical protein